MYRAIGVLLLLVSGWAHALTFSPMYYDKLVYTDYHSATFKLENTANIGMGYEVTVIKLGLEGDIIYRGETQLGAKEHRSIGVPIEGIAPNTLEVYYVCVKEKSGGKGWGIIGRTCAKLRLYYPRSELQRME